MSGIRTANKGPGANGKLLQFTNAFDAGLLEQNYWGDGSDGDLTISSNTTWDSGSGGDMIVKNFNNLTVNSGVTLTIKGRKGCMVYVRDTFINNGYIDVQSGYSCDPVAAGVPSTGLRIIRAKSGGTDTLSATDLTGCGALAINAEAKQPPISGNGKIYTISRTGASGGAANADAAHGNSGYSGGVLQAGGGGGGGGYVPVGGGNATCFSGGAGAGGHGGPWGYGGGTQATGGSSIGGAGGDGGCYPGYIGMGGAGNPAGVSGSGANLVRNPDSRSGGLLCLFVKRNFTNTGVIYADGGRGGAYNYDYTGNGGGSGGGIILGLYAGTYSNTGTMQSYGGSTAGTGWYGGVGGAGSIVIEQIAL